jgi:hypothetical protein
MEMIIVAEQTGRNGNIGCKLVVAGQLGHRSRVILNAYGSDGCKWFDGSEQLE